MVLSSYQSRDPPTGYWGRLRTHSSDSLARAEGLRKLRQRRDPKVATVLPPGLPLHRHSMNRSETKRRSRYVFPSKWMRRESKLPDSGTYPRHHGQTSRSWRASMWPWRDHHPARNPPGLVLTRVANRWNTIVAVEWRSGADAKGETMQDPHRRERQSKLQLSLGPSVSSSGLDQFEWLKRDVH